MNLINIQEAKHIHEVKYILCDFPYKIFKNDESLAMMCELQRVFSDSETRNWIVKGKGRGGLRCVGSALYLDMGDFHECVFFATIH